MAVQAKHVMSSTLVLSLLTLAGCKKPGDTPPQPSASAAPAVAAQPYVPPTADQLQQMVAPIALFPDKLVGQVLAGATYPAQITAADQWVQQNPGLKGDALQAAEANQPWDVSVKSLTAFPSVLDQMAGNIQWTTALGEAYANDPNDVMNAIQVMRVRAQQAGTLKNSPHLRVSTTVRAAPPAATYVEPAPLDTVVYAGPPVIPPPPQTIVIEPAEPDVVYVPHYNPTVVYGAPVPVYPGWSYREPAYVASDLVTTGAITFGLGVLVGAAVSHHHDWGWNAWGVNWGGPAYGGGWHRPAVVYNNTTYVTKSVTVVNRVNNINNINITNNHFRGGPGPAPAFAPGAMPGPRQQGLAGPGMLAAHAMPARPSAPPAGPMSMPHFTARDAVPGTRPPPAAMPAMHMTPPTMAQRDFRQQPGAAPVMRDGRGAALPSQAMMDRQHLDAARERAAQAQQRGNPGMPPARLAQQAEVAQAQQRMPMQRADAGMPHPPMQHAEGQPQRPPMQNAEPQMPRPPVQHAEAPMQRSQTQYAETQQRGFAQRAEAPAQRPPMPRPEAQMPHRDNNALDHPQARAIRQDVAAMHPRPAERPQPQAQHAERHEQAARHENHDKREHHG